MIRLLLLSGHTYMIDKILSFFRVCDLHFKSHLLHTKEMFKDLFEPQLSDVPSASVPNPKSSKSKRDEFFSHHQLERRLTCLPQSDKVTSLWDNSSLPPLYYRRSLAGCPSSWIGIEIQYSRYAARGQEDFHATELCTCHFFNP